MTDGQRSALMVLLSGNEEILRAFSAEQMARCNEDALAAVKNNKGILGSDSEKLRSIEKHVWQAEVYRDLLADMERASKK